MRMSNTLHRLFVYLLIASLLLVSNLSFLSHAENEVENLENELSGLNQEAESISDELSYIISQLDATNQELEQTKEALAKAKGEEEVQYESMKTRIKYMYENSTTTLLDVLFSSHGMAEFLSRMTFMSSISEYDRNAMEELVATQEEIAKKEATLAEKQKTLADLQNTLIAKEADLQNRINIASAELDTCRQKIKEAKEKAARAEAAAKQKVEPVYPEPEQETEKPPTVNRDPIADITASDVELLAALIECEAGSSHYEGMLAVGSVVVNRMKSRYYPDTLRGVVFQSGQFPPATNGLVENVLSRGIKDSCKQAAEDALAGKNNVGDCVSFRAASSGHAGTIIGDNVFF